VCLTGRAVRHSVERRIEVEWPTYRIAATAAARARDAAAARSLWALWADGCASLPGQPWLSWRLTRAVLWQEGRGRGAGGRVGMARCAGARCGGWQR
jgi:hypothetical protein